MIWTFNGHEEPAIWPLMETVVYDDL